MAGDVRVKASNRISSAVVQSHEFNAANFVACYLPMKDEVDTARVILRAWCANKRVYAPVAEPDGVMIFRELMPDTRLEKNAFGLWEPKGSSSISCRQLDLIITPLVAFDPNCNRIGMGGGYFDRSFAFLKHRRQWLRPKLMGVAFDCQEVKKIEVNPWDIRLYSVITESRLVRRRNG